MNTYDGTTPDNDLVRSLSNSRRRLTLRILDNQTAPVTVQELATHVAAEEQSKSLIDVTRDEREAIQLDLYHAQLPCLEANDLVEWQHEKDAVTTTEHPALSDPTFQRMLDVEADEWDSVLTNLADDRHRTILDILKGRGQPIARADLAKAVVTQNQNDGESENASATVAEVNESLHHLHLPKLHEAGLVTYNTETGAVSYEGHHVLEDEWFSDCFDDLSRAIVPSAQKSDTIWTVEGRENVIARGQSLFEQADDELFLMFTTEGLLEEGCIRCLQDAVDRGVDVYLGSQTQEVRDLVRERVPEAVIWEPQLDWLNLPPKYEKVGRLVFADREAIMLATLGEQAEYTSQSETAITGTGENNPLVVLMRELLGSRLDHLDAQSEEFLSEIPL